MIKETIILPLLLQIAVSQLYPSIDDPVELLRTAMYRTLQISSEFVAAMSRIQHMKWSKVLQRLPEYITFSTYLKEIGFDYAKVQSFATSIEEELHLDQFPQPAVYIRPSFQPFFEYLLSSMSKDQLIEGIATTLARYPTVSTSCSNLRSFYVSTLMDMVIEHKTVKRMIAEFQDMDFNLEEFIYSVIEMVSLTCTQIELERIAKYGNIKTRQ